MSGFFYGDKPPASPAEVEQRRRIASAMALRVAGQTPKNLGEGLGLLGAAILGRVSQRRADKAEAAGTAGAQELLRDLLGGGSSATSGSEIGGPPVAPSQSSPQVAPRMDIPPDAAPGTQTAMTGPANQVYDRMIAEGMQPHQAAAIVGNLMQESGPGLNTGAVGDGGNSFGMAQWNGPRMQALQAFAGERGTDPSDLQTQIDFLVHEMQGPESAAFEAIKSAPDLESATLAASDRFWRPGTPMNENRVNYAQDFYNSVSPDGQSVAQPVMVGSGGGGTLPAPAAAGPAQMAQADPSMQQILAAVSSPYYGYLNEGQQGVVNALMQQALRGPEGMTPYQAAQLQLSRDKFDYEKTQGSKDTALESKIGALEESGLDRNTAIGIAAGRYATSRDPITGQATIIDKATGQTIGQASPEAVSAAEEAQTADAGPSLYDQAETATGVVPGIAELSTDTLGQIPGIGGIFSFPDTVEARTAFKSATNDLIRSLSINPRFPVSEMERIREEIQITPGSFTSPEGMRARMRSVDRFLRTKLESQRTVANDPSMPKDARQSAIENVAAIERFIGIMGVSQGDEGGQAAPAQPQAQPAPGGPAPGTIEDGYRFKGGDPADQNNWERVQ